MVPSYDDATREELLAHLRHVLLENQQLLAEVEYFRQRSLALVRLGNPEQENEALLEGYRKYRHFFEKGASLNLVISTEGLIEDVNESFLRVFGYDRMDIIGRPVMDLVVAEQREQVAQHIMDEFGGKPIGQITIEAYAKDGSIRTVLSSSDNPAATIYKAGVPVRMFVAFVDITKRRQAELQLEQRSEELVAARQKIATLGQLLAVCPACSKVRQGDGDWQEIERLLRDLSGEDFQQSLCPECAAPGEAAATTGATGTADVTETT